jgi:hypothetical protein
MLSEAPCRMRAVPWLVGPRKTAHAVGDPFGADVGRQPGAKSAAPVTTGARRNFYMFG